ncbi:MAG: indolepyruvate oxidoreductase subunit beta family protein [Pseudolabrys sp.]
MDASVTKVRPISIAILALGGEGGGVLADWIVDLAQHGGHLAQSTSIPGVAQRTGATIYYVELFPKLAAKTAGRDPVLSLVPMPGDVEIVLASELMEAARAIERGFVTPDRTLLIASTHRVYAMTEKIALGDGRVDPASLMSACRDAANRLVAFDMAGIAEATGSALSAVLFGALAGSGALPFPRMAFEAAIRRGGVGVASSVAAFAAGFEAARDDSTPSVPVSGARGVSPPAQDLMRAAERDFPADVLPVVAAGIERLTDYQDAAYARLYLDRLAPFVAIARQHRDGARLLDEVARQLALAMAYEDTVRVAELKIRPNRFARVRDEVKVDDGQILEIAEFFHPRTQEIADTLPAGVGRWLMRTAWARRLLDRFTRKGRIVRTTSINGFALLYLLAGLKRRRRRSLRFANEDASIVAWLRLVEDTAPADERLAVEIARARSLVTGYSDTHARGEAKFDRLMSLVPPLRARPGAADELSKLIAAALADEDGKMLDRAVAALETG